jgi:MOSC domain-containing protein YiiM
MLRQKKDLVHVSDIVQASGDQGEAQAAKAAHGGPGQAHVSTIPSLLLYE